MEQSTPSQSICLNMIVKNESHIIQDTLHKLLQKMKFAYWVICDTGSTDSTKQCIQDFFSSRGIPGELIDSEWRDFAHNRTIAIQNAYKKTDYVFVWDADDEIQGDFHLPPVMDADWYTFTFSNPSGLQYIRPQLFRNTLRWKYESVLHEYAVCEEHAKPHVLVKGNYHFVSGRSGDRSKDPNKYLKDALILEKAYYDCLEKKDPMYNRYAFYCASSYLSCGKHEEALVFYKKVLTHDNWSEEKYNSCLHIYELYKTLGKEEEGLGYLVQSHQYNPKRVEGIYRLITYYCFRKQYDISFMYYTLIQNYYEHEYSKEHLQHLLFVHVKEFEIMLPYYIIIVAQRTNQMPVGAKMYSLLSKTKPVHDTWHMSNLFYNLQFYTDYLPKDNSFFQNMLEYFDLCRNQGIQFNASNYDAMSKFISCYKPLLTSTVDRPILVSGNSNKVLFSITTCKRLDLFVQTMNSILSSWKDISFIDSFLCVDDNSTEADRLQMKSLYPFFQFYFKTPQEKGHRISMNYIWNHIQTTQPKYWIHLEDDWLFFREDSYVRKSMDFLDRHESRNIHQVLFNKNYAETFQDHSILGGIPIEHGFLLHEKKVTAERPSSAYWPHYSFRPSMMRASAILDLGNYDSPNIFFERDYADRYFAKGHASAFFDTVSCLHIGKLTSEKNGSNAYSLNEENQGVKNQTPIVQQNKTFILNLHRRPDRRLQMIKEFADANIESYSFFVATDGYQLQASERLAKLFHGNDFGSRCGFLGAALSHYRLWKNLLTDSCEMYTIFEDDIRFVSGAKPLLQRAQIDAKTSDIFFLGHSLFSHHESDRTMACETGKAQWDKEKYIGGLFGYILTKSGAKKLCDYIEKNGIRHGIDYILKLVPDLQCWTAQPHIVLSDWVKTLSSSIDSDIQKNYDCLDLSTYGKIENDWTFFRNLDSGGNDIEHTPKQPMDVLAECSQNQGAVGWNTLGFTKSLIQFPLIKSKYLQGGDDGLYVRKLRVKMLCNWCSSKELCDEWNKMSKGDYTWNGIQIVWEGKADYYVIINKPQPRDQFEPSKTIVFHMEPWCGLPTQTWGVKTWGEWSRPDPQNFLMVRSHDRVVNTGFWQVSWTYNDFKTKPIQKSDELNGIISSICSSKQYDPGHVKRIDFLHFLEQNGVNLHIYNSDNKHGFASYMGKADPFVDKEKGLVPYKYYFMCENNAEKNFITEKLWEPILCETLCFYWGCPNVSEILDPLSYIQLDMNNFQGSLEIIQRTIRDNEWEKRIPVIRKEKERILEYFGFFPTLERVLYSGERIATNNVCFLHCCNLPNRQGEAKLAILLHSLLSTGAIRLFDSVIINVIGKPLQYIETVCKQLDSRIEFKHHSSDTNLFELPTLRLLHDYACLHPTANILYLHTKSISYDTKHPLYVTTMSWIEYMLYFLVERASACLEKLLEYDVVGCDHLTSPKPHFSGNFWWAKAGYVNRLDPTYLSEKMDAETWLFTKQPNMYSCHQSNTNLFETIYPRSKYVTTQ